MKKHIAAGVICLAVSVAVLDAHVVVTPRDSAAGAEHSTPYECQRRAPSPDLGRARYAGRSPRHAGRLAMASLSK